MTAKGMGKNTATKKEKGWKSQVEGDKKESVSCKTTTKI